MNEMIPILTEAGALLLAALLAALAARPLRRRQPGPGLPEVIDAGFPTIAAAAVMPLLVLVISWSLYEVITKMTALADYLPAAWASHRKAWMLLWFIVLGVRVFEAALSAYYRKANRRIPVPDLLRSLLRTTIYVGASFFLLHEVVGMNIAPLLTSTALLTAVVGFALQGVLGNLLAGMSLHIVRSVLPADWVALGDVEGQVVETNWRETRLRTVAGHMLIVPNSKMAESILHNMSQPTALRRHKVDVGASYSDAPDEVIAALLEAARSVPEVLPDPPPSAYAVEFKDFGINYRVRFWSNSYPDRTPIEGDVARMVWYKFKRRGIEIPFPMSDKLLNDFMEVVYRQRTQPPEDHALDRRVSDLMRSEFMSRILVDAGGAPMVTRDEIRSMAKQMRHVLYTRGETLFRQDDPGETCYVLVRGSARGEILQPGVPEAIRFSRGPGSMIGEMSLITGQARTATITFPEESELLEVPGPAFTHLLSLRKEIPEILSHVVAARAMENAQNLDKARSQHTGELQGTIKRETILQRFLHLIQRAR
jgi:small-conductance mechanosensitive channel/CRP-like cAMP-binding protein